MIDYYPLISETKPNGQPTEDALEVVPYFNEFLKNKIIYERVKKLNAHILSGFQFRSED